MIVCISQLTIGGWVAQNLCNVLVGWVLAQSAHDVGHLVVGHLVVTDSVEEAERLLEVWPRERRENFEFQSNDTSWSKETNK